MGQHHMILYCTQSNDRVPKRNASCVVNILTISTKSIPLYSPYSRSTNKPNFIVRTPLLLMFLYLATNSIFQVTPIATLVHHPKNNITELTLPIMETERWNFAHLMAERMVNTVILISWRYLKYLRCRPHSLERGHLIGYSFILDDACEKITFKSKQTKNVAGSRLINLGRK